MLLFLSETLESNGIIKKQATNYLKLNIKKNEQKRIGVLSTLTRQSHTDFLHVSIIQNW